MVRRTEGRTPPGVGSILINFFEAHPVGHVIEALHYCLGHRKANPEVRLGLVLNATAPTELAELCRFVDEVYPVELPGYPEEAASLSGAECLAALKGVPAEWDYVLDNPRRSVAAHRRAVPGFARYYEASDRHFRARLGRAGVRADPPGYTPHQELRLELPQDNRRWARSLLPEGERAISVLFAGSSERSLYPSTASWETILEALGERFPDARLRMIGKLGADGRTATNMTATEVARLRRASPCAVDLFDAKLPDQLAAVQACDLFISPHSGFGMAALAVGTPWLTISGGRWPEYFFNGVPFYSLLPDTARFPAYSQFGSLPILDEDTDGEGPRTTTMSHERILSDLNELLAAAEQLVEGRSDYRSDLEIHFEKLLRFHGGDRDRIFTIDNLHSEFL